MYQFAATHNATFYAPNLRVAWVATLGGRINGGLAAVNQTIYADSFDGRLYALNMVTGEIRWSASAADVLMSTPVVSGGRVLVGSGHDGFLETDNMQQIWGQPGGDDILAFAANDGKELWRFHTIGEDMASPAIVGDTAVFANGDLHTYALALSNGSQRWRHAVSGIDTMASATVDRDIAVIGLCHNSPHFRETIAVSIRQGAILWKNRNGSCDSSAVIDNGRVFVDGNDETTDTPFDPGGSDIIASIDEYTGRTLWTRRSPAGPYTMVASGEHAIAGVAFEKTLYQSIVNRNLFVALDERTGHERWRFRTMAPVKMSAIVVRGKLIFGDTAGLLYVVSASTGTVLRTIAFKDPFSTSPPIAIGQTVFIANGNNVFALPLNVIGV